MTLSLLVCLGAFLLLLWVLRRDRVSLGLPIAYLGSLLLIHVPGALAHLLNPDLFYLERATEIGFGYAATGAACFVAGVWVARLHGPVVRPANHTSDEKRFRLFCLVGGWAFVYVLSPLHYIPSIGAVVDEGGAVWMLGVLLGLRAAVRRGDIQSIGLWNSALIVYPALMLLFGGFLSYGSAAIIIVTAALTISARKYGRAVLGIALASFLGLSLFVNYFHHRDSIREEVWGGAPLSDRLGSVEDMFAGFQLFDPTDPHQAESLDARLNQNYFVGLAAQRITSGEVSYLYGRSIWDALIALVPRALWPDKPVTAGSPEIVSEMTGLTLSPTTSWGVGNVMEFEINFGLFGVIAGFLILGFLLGRLDVRAAAAVRRGEFGRAVFFFLPAVALIDPQGSMVEMASGSAAALLAAFGWNWAWENWKRRRPALAQRRSLTPFAADTYRMRERANDGD